MPKFNKRHYEAIAQVLQEIKPPTDDKFTPMHRQWIITINELSRLFARDNSGFQLGRFERACEPGANVRARKAA